MMRISDVCLAFPGLVFALAIAALLNGGLVNAVFALAAISWPKYARIARSQTLRLKDSDFLAAAKMSGATTAAQIWRHILPNAISPIIVAFSINVAGYILSEAGLSYLGLGVAASVPTWGNILNAAKSVDVILNEWWLWVLPGVVLLCFVLSVYFLGVGLRDVFDRKG